MIYRNTETTYGAVAKIFHWVMFVVMIGLLGVGFYMGGLPADTPDQIQEKITFYDYHKSFGLLILLLVVLRLAWRMANPAPNNPSSMRRIEEISAQAMHILLYIIMIIQPLTGWLMSSAAGSQAKFFGLKMPLLVAKDKETMHLFHEIHEIVAFLLIAAIILHGGAALFHHFVRKDNVLTRMLPHASDKTLH